MDVYDFGKEKRFKHSSSPSAVFPINLCRPHFSAVCGHISPHIQLQQPGCGTIRAVLAPLSTAATEVALLIFLSHLLPWEGKDIEEKMRAEVSQVSPACHPLMSLDWDTSGDPNLLLHQQLPVQMCLGSPSDATYAYGSNWEVMQGMVPGQHLQTLFCIISALKYYIVLPCQDIFTALDNGNRKVFCLLAGGFGHICSSLI